MMVRLPVIIADVKEKINVGGRGRSHYPGSSRLKCYFDTLTWRTPATVSLQEDTVNRLPVAMELAATPALHSRDQEDTLLRAVATHQQPVSMTVLLR